MADGSAQQPSSPPTHSNLFPVGSIVEVRSDDANFKDTYFSGTVFSLVSYSKVTVTYHNRFKDEDGSTPLTEEVDTQCLRPSPAPDEIVKGFEPGDVVDAFYKGDWCIGLVRSRVAKGEERRYLVVFHNPPNVLEFSFSELRVHWDWDNGNWIRLHNKSGTRFMFNVGSEVEISPPRNKSAWYPGTIEYLGNRINLLVKCGSTNTNEPTRLEMVDSLNVRPSPPFLKNNNFVLMQNVDAFFDYGWWSRIIIQKLANNRYVVFIKQLDMTRDFDDSHLRSHMDLKNGIWLASYQVAAPHLKEADIHEFPSDSSAEKPKQSEIVESSQKQGKRGKPQKSPAETIQNVTALAIDMDTSPLPNQVKSLNKDIVVLEEFSEKHQESEVLIPIMDKNPVALMGPQNLPFLKSSILWKSLEAMDLFQKIPQNPHFQPLQHITEGLREGEAIGYMVTFAGVVDKVCGLQYGDPKSVTDKILGALAELEDHGFNVKPIKDRVLELLVVKEKAAIPVGDVKEINGRILDHRQQKHKVEEEIEGIKKEIQKMEQRLLVLESAKEKEEGETVAALHCLMKIADRNVDAKQEFERIVSSAF